MKTDYTGCTFKEVNNFSYSEMCLYLFVFWCCRRGTINNIFHKFIKKIHWSEVWRSWWKLMWSSSLYPFVGKLSMWIISDINRKVCKSTSCRSVEKIFRFQHPKKTIWQFLLWNEISLLPRKFQWGNGWITFGWVPTRLRIKTVVTEWLRGNRAVECIFD